MTSAALALGVTELVSGVEANTPGSIASVGRAFISWAPGSLERWAIDTFGTGDKPALLAGIVVICLLLGALVGVVAQRQPAAAPFGFGVFAVAGALAALDDPLVPTAIAVAAPMLGAYSGIFALLMMRTRLLQSTMAPPAPPATVAATATPSATSIVVESPTNPHASRRAFFAYAGGAAALAATAAGAGKALRGRGAAEQARAQVRLPAGSGRITTPADTSFDAITGLTPRITPNEDFYLIDTALLKPQVNPANWKLTIEGMVERPYELTFDEILAMDLVDEELTIACVSNEVGDDLIGNAVWTGVPLLDVLDRAGIQPGATQVAQRSVDGWTCGFPTELLRDGRPALLVVGMNGEPLPIIHGFPARVVVSGLYGYVSATKWIETITLTTWEDFDGYWMDKGWSKEGPVKTQCRIDVPRRGRTLVAGPAPIAGVAWAPIRGISKVEVRVDEGDWVEATLSSVGTDFTWIQWMAEWEAVPGEHVIDARATDGEGETQTAAIAPPAPNGATGYPRRSVVVEDA